jgi:hypothetical protein
MSAGAFPDILRRVNFDRRRGAIVMGGSGGRTGLFPIGFAVFLRSRRLRLRTGLISSVIPGGLAREGAGLTRILTLSRSHGRDRQAQRLPPGDPADARPDRLHRSDQHLGGERTEAAYVGNATNVGYAICQTASMGSVAVIPSAR